MPSYHDLRNVVGLEDGDIVAVDLFHILSSIRAESGQPLTQTLWGMAQLDCEHWVAMLRIPPHVDENQGLSIVHWDTEKEAMDHMFKIRDLFNEILEDQGFTLATMGVN